MCSQSDSDKIFQDRIRFLEEQYQSLKLNMKYQRYRLLKTDDQTVELLLRLVPYKIRSVEEIRSLANSHRSWRQVFWRHPLKIKLWMTVKRLQRSRRA